MDDDLLFHNKFVSDLKVSNTYDIKNINKETAFREYIEKKKNIVGLNDEDTDIFEEHVMTTNPLVLNKDGSLNKERHVVERRYIYNISSKTRQITKSDYVEKEVVTNEYVKVTTNSFGEIVYESIDIDELNEEYNALDIPNSVVNPFYMIGEDMYFKSFLYRTPDEYIIDLPLMHTNVKSIRLLSSVIPCTVTNINKYNNHIMIDILFGSAQVLENLDFDVVFGTFVAKIPYGNYTIDTVCSKIVSLINEFYYNNYKNNSGLTIYDITNMLTTNSFKYNYDSISGELYFSLDQPSQQSSIETLVIAPITVYENIIIYDTNTIQLPLVTYNNFLEFIRTIAATMNYDFNGFIDYGNSSFIEQFIVFQKSNKIYLCSLFSPFTIDLSNSPNIALTFSFSAPASNELLFIIDVTNGETVFDTFNSTGKNNIIFIMNNTNTTYTSSIGNFYYTNYILFIQDVIKAMNNNTYGYPSGNFVLSTQQQLLFNKSTYTYDLVTRYYIIGDEEFTLKCGSGSGNMDSDLVAAIFGTTTVTSDVYSTVNAYIMTPNPSTDFLYTPSSTTEILFTFNGASYTAYIPSINYSNYDAFITAVVQAMNITCKTGFFAFDKELNNNNTYDYALYTAGTLTMHFGSMLAVGTYMMHPYEMTDVTSTNSKIILTEAYNAAVNPYNAYVSDYSNFYINIRQKVPDPPFEDDPSRTNSTIQISLLTGTYTTVSSLLADIETTINTFINNAKLNHEVWLKDDKNSTNIPKDKIGLSFTLNHSENKINISCTSEQADLYEFNIDGSLMVSLASFLGISINSPTTYYTSYNGQYTYGNRLRFKMSFENNPNVSQDDQLWYMLGFRSNNSLGYVETPWTNIFDFGDDSYYFSSTSFINTFIPTRSTEVYPNIEDKRPYRLPSMEKSNYIYLQINNYENMYDPSIPNEKIYTKILLSEDYGKYAFNTFIDNPYVLSTTDSRLDRLQIKFIDKNANSVDFNNIDHTITIEIVEYSDRLSANDYNTRRGYNEHTSYPQALYLGHGK